MQNSHPGWYRKGGKVNLHRDSHKHWINSWGALQMYKTAYNAESALVHSGLDAVNHYINLHGGTIEILRGHKVLRDLPVELDASRALLIAAKAVCAAFGPDFDTELDEVERQCHQVEASCLESR